MPSSWPPLEEIWKPRVLEKSGGAPWHMSADDLGMDGEAISREVELHMAAEEEARKGALQ